MRLLLRFLLAYTDTNSSNNLKKSKILYVRLNNVFLLCSLIPILTVERFCSFFI